MPPDPADETPTIEYLPASAPDDSRTELIGTPLSSAPDWLTGGFEPFGPCPECGVTAVMQSDPGERTEKYMCCHCGVDLSVQAVVESTRSEPDEDTVVDVDGETESTDEQTMAEAKTEANEHMASILSLLGIMFCLTIIGIPVGLIFLYLGAQMQPDDE